MVAQFGLPVVEAYMRHVQDNAAESVRRVIDALHDCQFAYEMDQGTWIKVKISVDKEKREATVDFAGTSPQQPSNFNAPEPVTARRRAVCLPVMVDDDIPMNAGCLEPVRIVIPPGSMLSPRYPAAVVAGNVETSQAVTNCLFGALGAMAAAQGTMNNLNFGNETYQYYETICSGSPAGPGFRAPTRCRPHDQYAAHRSGGAEFRYPVVLEDFHIPRRSGGAAAGTRAMASPASSGSLSRWNARSCRATGGCARSGSPAARPEQVRRELGAPPGRAARQARRLRRHHPGGGRGDHHPNTDGGGYGEPADAT